MASYGPLRPLVSFFETRETYLTENLSGCKDQMSGCKDQIHDNCFVFGQKMLAKLLSSVNKPNMQTCLLEGGVAEFLLPMSVRKVGFQL